MAGVTQTTWFQTAVGVFLALLVIGLIGKARGEESDDGRVQDADVVVVVDRD
jgi:hypothetical protein